MLSILLMIFGKSAGCLLKNGRSIRRISGYFHELFVSWWIHLKIDEMPNAHSCPFFSTIQALAYYQLLRILAYHRGQYKRDKGKTRFKLKNLKCCQTGWNLENKGEKYLSAHCPNICPLIQYSIACSILVVYRRRYLREESYTSERGWRYPSFSDSKKAAKKSGHW